jgi:hypothetical protein
MAEEDSPELQQKLNKVEGRLEAALGEVCEEPSVRGGVRRPNTGELVRIDQELALASEAVKQAIALRRRLHAGSRSPRPDDKPLQERPG